MVLSACLIGAAVAWQPMARACDTEYYYDEYTNTYSYTDGEYYCVVTEGEAEWGTCYEFYGCYEDGWAIWEDGYCENECDPDDNYSWYYEEGSNPFHVGDGNATRAVKELTLPGFGGRHFSWIRHHNTVPRVGRTALGQAGSWRHNWQYELTLLPGRNGHLAACDFTSPAGMRRKFERTDDGFWLPAARFPERLEEAVDGFVLISSGGMRLHFVALAGDGPEGRRYEMRELTDPHGLVTRLDYDELGNVTKVTDPAGRFFELTYRELPQQKRFERKIAWLDSVAPGADGWVEVAVPAWFAQNQSFRYVRCVTEEGTAAGVAEAQYFAPGATQPLAGVTLDGGAAFDLGAVRNIARVRVRPLAGASLAGVTVSGLDTRPASTRVLAGVRASDGRAVYYDYETVADPVYGFEYPSLVQARYGDGTTAHYRYQQIAPATQPLLVEANDPRYEGRAKRIQYAYRADHARGLGFIHQEINPATGGVYASLELDPADPDKRIVHYSDLRSVAYLTPETTNGRPTERTDALGRKTRFEYDEDGRLQAKVDHAGRRMEFARDEHGQIKAVRRDGRLEKQTVRDAQGRAMAVSDRHGRTTTYSRDANGRIVREVTAKGETRELTYNTLGQLTGYKSAKGLRQFTYNERGLKTSFTDQRGNITHFGYDAQDRRVSITDPLGRVTRREVNERGLTTKIIHPDGTTESFAYDSYGRKAATTGRQGRTTKLAYDELGRVTRQEDPDGRVSTFDYTELPQGCGSCTLAPNATRIVGSDGTVTTRLYDTEGRLLAHTLASDTPDAATTLYAYDNDNNLISVTDPLGAITRYTYDDDHHRLTATDPLGRVTRWTYDDRDNVTSMIAPDGGVTRSEYDANDRLIRTTDAAGNVTLREYDAVGNVVVLTDATGERTRHTYDGKRKASTQFSDGKRQTWEYDAAGRPVRETTEDGGQITRTFDTGNRVLTIIHSAPSLPSPTSSVFTYDPLGRRTSATDPLGRTTRWIYDSVGNVLAEVRPDGLQTTYTYDARNRRTSTTDAAGNMTRFEYDTADNQTTLIDARGSTYRFTYDSRHRKTAMSYPDGSQEVWVYDLSGRLVGYANRAGQTKTIAYNAGGQPVSETWSDSVMVGGALRPDIPRPTTYQYDAAGRLRLLDNGQAKLAYTYDALGRVALETSDLSALVPGLAVHTVRYGFDVLGRKSDLTYPDGSKVSYEYDPRGRLESISDGPGRAVGRYDYDPSGRIEKLTRDNNVVTSYAYDMAGQLTDIAHIKGNTVLAGTHYSLDQLGRRIAQTREDNITESYAYDVTGQLTGVEYGAGRTEGCAYDPVGNRTSTVNVGGVPSPRIAEYTTNALNQYTQVGGVPFAYDGNGNLIDDGRQRYVYDAQNRLMAVESASLEGAFPPDSVRAEFHYDARNRCVLRKYYTLGSQGQWMLNQVDSRALTYDSRWNLLAERTLDGRQAGAYIHGQRVDEILQWTGSDGAKLCPLADGLGSTVALANQQGRVTERYRYDAFGAPRVLSTDYSPLSIGSAYRFLFTGREWLNSIKLHEHRYRYYSVDLGRWTSSDPIHFNGDYSNLYRYVYNQPVNYLDPTGLVLSDAPVFELNNCASSIADSGTASISGSATVSFSGQSVTVQVSVSINWNVPGNAWKVWYAEYNCSCRRFFGIDCTFAGLTTADRPCNL